LVCRFVAVSAARDATRGVQLLAIHALSSARTTGPDAAIGVAVKEDATMSTPTTTAPTDEPLGIIISRGAENEPTPRVASYVWGPVPDLPADDASKAA